MNRTSPSRFELERTPGWVLKLSAGPDRRPQLDAKTRSPLLSVAEDGIRTVVLDGVLHNRAELGARPAEASAARPEAADVVLNAYVRFGAAVLEKLRGIYALVIWDGAAGRLLFARDPAGIHPFFYTDAGDELLVSTCTESLLRHPSVLRTVSRSALADHLCHGYPQKVEETYYSGIRRLPPGHALQADGAARRVFRYWDPAPPERPIEWAREEELEGLQGLLRGAVDRCLELGTAGIYLSGGLDSATVAVLASDGSRDRGLPPPLALSLVFPHPECNEEVVQRTVAARLALPQIVASFDEAAGARGLLAAALTLSSEWPWPLPNLFEPGFQYLGAEARRRGCQVVLNGGGGDEWLALSPDYARDLVRKRDAAGLYRLWDARRRYLPLSPLSVGRSIVWRSGVRPLLRDAVASRVPRAFDAHRRRRRADSIPRWLAPDPQIRRELHERAEAEAQEAPMAEHYLVEKRRTLDHPLEALVMDDLFVAGQRVGLRMLQPLWDVDVVDLLYRTPPGMLIRGGREKGLVRDLLASRFPELGREWVKTVFMDGFLRSVVLREGPEAWRRLGGTPALAEVGLVDPERLRSFVEERLSDGGHPTHEIRRIWNILSLEAWLRPRL
jgi:asparagine synthase (glutamine-hydrolysing)